MSSLTSALFSKPLPVFAAAALLRAGMLVYGLWQDASSPVKYTDIDYMVFTDAARFTFSSSSTQQYGSPYTRETYRYTPLLAWLLWPTALAQQHSSSPLLAALCFSSGKILFALADLLAGWLLLLILQREQRMPTPRALRYASIWLLNPMVATISTRGSSEGLLGVLVTALLWAALRRRVVLTGLLLGLGVHFKIYPFIYAPALVWWMDAERMGGVGGGDVSSSKNNKNTKTGSNTTFSTRLLGFLTRDRIVLTIVSLATFQALNTIMYLIYGYPFVLHTFLHHVTRIDHRHNFSPYNVLLYLTSSSSSSSSSPSQPSTIQIESLAFLPQLLLSTILIPFAGAKKDLPTTMLAQTFAFVNFNKVCTSQYFLWYQVLLPLYLPRSSLLSSPAKGITALVLWIAGQALWLWQGYGLEFLGLSTFVPGLWLASLGFFLANCWILGVVVEDLAAAAAAALGGAGSS